DVAVLGGDPFQHFHPFAQFLDLALERGVVAREGLFVAHRIRGDPVPRAVLGLEELAQRYDGDDDDDRGPQGHCAFLPSSSFASRSASICRATSKPLSVTIRSTTAMRSFIEPSSARNEAFSWVSSLIRSLDSASVPGLSDWPHIPSIG